MQRYPLEARNSIWSSKASELSGRVVVEAAARVVQSVVRGPAIIGRGAVIENAYVGPFTAIGDGVTIRGSEIEHSIILEGSEVSDVGARIESSLLGRGGLLTCGGGREQHRQHEGAEPNETSIMLVHGYLLVDWVSIRAGLEAVLPVEGSLLRP